MKIAVAFSLLFAAPSFAVVDSFYITATGGAPIPAAYNNANTQSKVLDGIQYKTSFCAYNGTANMIAFNIDNGSLAANPSSADGLHEIMVPPGLSRCVSTPNISSRVLMRAQSSTTTGYVLGDAE